MWMPVRSYEREYLDDHEPEQPVIDRVYRFLVAINRHLGGAAATIARFEAFSQTWQPGDRITVLDVASGAADIPRLLIAWGRARGFDIRVTALDVSTRALSYAQRAGSADGLTFVSADVNRLPFGDGAFDYAMCALFFHHLRDDEILAVLRHFDRVAARGIVVNDLVRNRRLFLWTKLFTLPFHSILRHDGPLSVKRALRADELGRLAVAAGLPWLAVHRHFGHRMTLSGHKPSAASATRSARRSS